MKFSRMIRQGLTALALAGMATVSAGPSAQAATETGDLTVTASVLAACTVAGGTLAFANYDPSGAHAAAPLDTLGSFDITCASGLGLTIRLGQGLNPQAGSTDAVPLRAMAQAGEPLPYFLYQGDPSTAPAWGNTSGTGLASAGTGAVQSLTVGGRIPAGQIVSSGTGYTDTVVVSVDF